MVALGGRPPLPLWRAGSVRQTYLPGTNVLRTVARFGEGAVAIECAAAGGELGCVSRRAGGGGGPRGGPPLEVVFRRDLLGGGTRVHLDDPRAPAILAEARAAGRRWLSSARPLGPGAPAWARRLYARSLLVLRALADRRSGAVAAGARDGWAYVWPRDAGAVAIALASAGRRAQARRTARFLLALDLDAAARFEGDGDPVGGREAQGDAGGWTAAAARAAGLPEPGAGHPAPLTALRWRDRADYQEKSPGEYLGNALAAGAQSAHSRFLIACREEGGFPCRGGPGTARYSGGGGDPRSGFDSAAAWAVRPFPRPALFAAARRTLAALGASQESRFGPGATRFGLVPSQSWPEADPWTAPTAWSAWSLAALARLGGPGPAAGRDRRAALRLLAALRRAATPAGLLPERVDERTGVPRSTTPLAWSHAFAVLALRELWPARAAPRR